jgi:hypothetical protein
LHAPASALAELSWQEQTIAIVSIHVDMEHQIQGNEGESGKFITMSLML